MVPAVLELRSVNRGSTEMKKSTEELTNEIITADSISDWSRSETESFAELTLSEYLKQMLSCHSMQKKDAINRSEIDPIYGYQIFQGKKNPSRDILLQLAFGLGLSVDETKRLLYYGNTGTLYPRVKRDAYIMYALHNHYSISEVNQLLFENGETTF